MQKLILLVSLILLTACGQENTEKPSANRALDSTSLKQPLSIINEEVNLLPEARQQVVKWLAYITAQNEIDKLRTATIAQTIESAGPLAQIFENLQNTVPDSLQSKPVNARINVLVTKAKLLNQLAGRRDLNSDEIAETAEQIPLEFNNFKLQLNELFLKTIEDFEKELDEFQLEKDTLRSPVDSIVVD